MEYDKPSDRTYAKFEEDGMFKAGCRAVGDRTFSFIETTGKNRPKIGIEVSAQTLHVGDAKEYARFVGADFGVKDGSHAETFDGAEVKARLTLGEVKTEKGEIHLGLGVTTGATVEDGAVGVKVAGCGFKFGKKKVGVAVFDNEIAVDPSAIFGWLWK